MTIKYRYSVTLCLMSLLYIVAGPLDVRSQGVKMTPTSANDIWAKTLDSANYNEYWNYQMYFDNGMSLYIVFSVSNFGRLKSAVSGIRVSLYGLDGDAYHINREYPIDELLQNPQGHEFNINPRQDNIWFKGTLPDHHEIYINTQKHGHRFKIHLSLTDIQQGFKSGTGEYMVDDHRIGIATHIPFARVSGTAGINDNVKEVRGTAYMDHTWQYQNSSKKLKNGYRFVQLQDTGNWENVYFMETDARSGTRFIGYRLSSVDGAVTLQEVQSVSNSSSRDFQNNRMSISLTGGQKAEISSHSVVDVTSIFNDLNWVTRQLMRTVLGGEIMDTRGTAVLFTNGIRKQGFFNQFAVK